MDFNLFKIVREATKAVPAVKYGVGILGLVAIVAIIASLKIDLRIAVWGTTILIFLMILLVLFAKLTQVATTLLLGVIKVLLWFTISLFMITCLSLFTSVFLSWPLDLKYWIKDENKNFISVFTLVPDKQLNISSDYPKLEFPLDLNLMLAESIEPVTINGSEDNNQGSRSINAQYINTKVPIKLISKYWEIENDSLKLTDGRIFITIKPNQSLAIIQGMVKSWDEKKLISGARIQLGIDTILYSDVNGIFKAHLPYNMLKLKHRITIYADGYESSTDDECYPYNGTLIAFKLHPLK